MIKNLFAILCALVFISSCNTDEPIRKEKKETIATIESNDLDLLNGRWKKVNDKNEIAGVAEYQFKTEKFDSNNQFDGFIFIYDLDKNNILERTPLKCTYESDLDNQKILTIEYRPEGRESLQEVYIINKLDKNTCQLTSKDNTDSKKTLILKK